MSERRILVALGVLWPCVVAGARGAHASLIQGWTRGSDGWSGGTSRFCALVLVAASKARFASPSVAEAHAARASS